MKAQYDLRPFVMPPNEAEKWAGLRKAYAVVTLAIGLQGEELVGKETTGSILALSEQKRAAAVAALNEALATLPIEIDRARPMFLQHVERGCDRSATEISQEAAAAVEMREKYRVDELKPQSGLGAAEPSPARGERAGREAADHVVQPTHVASPADDAFTADLQYRPGAGCKEPADGRTRDWPGRYQDIYFDRCVTCGHGTTTSNGAGAGFVRCSACGGNRFQRVVERVVVTALEYRLPGDVHA